MVTFKPFNLVDYKDGLIVTDEKIADIYSIKGDNVYLLPQGEAAKTFEHAQALCKWFLSKNLQRGHSVAAIGGGSIGDTVGFACSIYKRGGVKLTHVPTTLLAQIDSSIGGKTALDMCDVKNAVGTYYQADTVIDVNFLKTLDDVQLKSGLGELFKYRMLSKEVNGLYNGEITEQVIKACVEYKQEICEIDPFDSDIRKMLNLGHTLGHAFEIEAGIPHGHAVANGLYYETALAYKLGQCSKEYYEYWTGIVAETFEIIPINETVIYMSLNDKKNSDKYVCFMLPDSFDENYLTADMVVSLLC